MIKRVFKSLLTFGIIGLGIINFSSATNYSQQFYLNYDEEITDGKGNTFTLTNNGNFLLNSTFPYFSYYTKNTNGKFMYNYFWFESGIYLTVIRPGTSTNQIINYGNLDRQGYIPFCELSLDHIWETCSYQSSNYVSDFYTNPIYANPYEMDIYYSDIVNDLQICFYYENMPNYKYCNRIDYGICFNKTQTCFTGSLGFGTSPAEPDELEFSPIKLYIRNSTWSSLGGSNWGGIIINSGSNATNNGDFLRVDCTNGSVKNWYQSIGYKSYLCYGGESYWSEGNYSTQMLIPGKGYNVFEIYNYMSGAIGTGQTYSTGNLIEDWFDYWRAQYGWWTNQYVSLDNPFVGNPRILFGLFSFVSKYGASYDSKAILDYCNLLINSDDSGVYTGRYSNYLKCNGNKDGQVDFTYNPGDGTGGNSVGDLTSSWSGTFLGVGSGSLGSGEIYSFSSFMTNFYDIVSKVFNGLVGFETRVGFLPWYIVATMLFLILFRFLSH